MTQSARRPLRPTWPIVAGFLALPLCAQDPFPLPPGAIPQNPEMPADKDPTTSPSGLQYSVLTPGTDGQPPKLGDLVRVHYTGFLTDGTVFDSSRPRGEPAQFVLGRVIEGWNEGLQLMAPGARFKLTIPAALAYGENGRPPMIPGDATLVFDVELLDVVFRAPQFKAVDPDAHKTTDSGLKYEPMTEGQGDAIAEDDVVEMKFSFWTKDGTLMDSTGYQPANLKGKIADFSLPFLKEALLMMKPGATYRFEVPESLGFPMQPGRPPLGDTVWELELVRLIVPLPVPKFEAPAADKLQKTESGLQYEVIEEGLGTPPKLGQQVEVHYAGWLEDGTLFDSSYGRGDPATFMLGQVIGGWNEGLQLMKPGATYRFVIPPGLAYGPQGSPPAIGPNATLIFQVKLIRVP